MRRNPAPIDQRPRISGCSIGTRDEARVGLHVEAQDRRRHRPAPEVPGPATRLAQLGSVQNSRLGTAAEAPCPGHNRRGRGTYRGRAPVRPSSTRSLPAQPRRRSRRGAQSTGPWTHRATSAWSARTTRGGTPTDPRRDPCPGANRWRRTETFDTRRQSDDDDDD